MSDRRHLPLPKFTGPMLAKSELDELAGEFRCPCPQCQGQIPFMSLKPSCHPAAGVDVAYLQGSGTLEIRCNHCGRPIIAVKVADQL